MNTGLHPLLFLPCVDPTILKEDPSTCTLFSVIGNSKGPNSVLPPQRDSGSERNMVDQGKNAGNQHPSQSTCE